MLLCFVEKLICLPSTRNFRLFFLIRKNHVKPFLRDQNIFKMFLRYIVLGILKLLNLSRLNQYLIWFPKP